MYLADVDERSHGFSQFEEGVFVLTVKHGTMDLPNRIAEIEPQLSQVAEMLYRTSRSIALALATR